jgi:hypothetical protein
MTDQYREKTPQPVDPERALEHGRLAIRRDWAGEVPGFERWHAVEIDPKPLVLHDLNGAELFYEFTVTDGKQAVGTLKASASRILGVAVAAVELGPRRWDPDQAVRGAREKARKRFPKGRIVGTELVCFSYPKIGVRVDVADGAQRQRSVIYDAADLSEVPAFGADEREGYTSWSFYREVAEPRAEEKVRRWELADRELEAVRKRGKSAVTANAFTDREVAKLRELVMVESPYVHMTFYSSRVLKFGPRCSPHDCFTLYAQQTSVYCAVATGQMILDFHRWPYTQNQIATAMGTDSGGTGNSGQVAGYESLTRNTLLATYDTSADWAEAKAEIDENRPLKSGISGHARACAGWKRQNLFIVGQPTKRWLQIYDPWPWNADICQGGAVVWEDWETVNHTNFIFVRHRTTAC